MAIQYENNSPSKDTDVMVKNNEHSPSFAVGGSTTTTERPTGGSVTQWGNAVAGTAAGGVFTSNGGNAGTIGGSRTEQGGNRRTENSTGTVAGTVSESMSAGSQISSYFSGGGKGLGAVLGNADAPNAVAVNPQGLNAGGINPLLLLLIPLSILVFRKK